MQHTSRGLLRRRVSDAAPLPYARSVVTLGSFDGVHLGHQTLMQQGRAIADREGMPLIALTFAPHPQEVLARMRKLPWKPQALMSLRERVGALWAAGADMVVALPFDATISGWTASYFVTHYLLDQLRAQHIVVGPRCGFGHRRAGSSALLQNMGPEHGFTVTVLPPYIVSLPEHPPEHPKEVPSEVIGSSSMIRAALRQGDFAQAQAMLGRPFAYCGRVRHGWHQARELGIPTANIDVRSWVRIPYGVYVGMALISGRADPLPALAYLNARRPVLEVHLLSAPNADQHPCYALYGTRLAFVPMRCLRPDYEYPSGNLKAMMHLKQQIAEDLAMGRAWAAEGAHARIAVQNAGSAASGI